MKQYEYTTEKIYVSSDEKLDERLNELGKDGWLALTSTFTHDENGSHFSVKLVREKECQTI